jgi:MFS family permease
MHLPMGMVADRMNKHRLMISGGILICLGMLLYYIAGSQRTLYLAGILIGIGGGISMPALMALAVIKGGQNTAMGSVMSLITMAHSLGQLCGAILAGLIMDYLSLRIAFPVGAGLVAAATLFLLLVPDQEPAHAHVPLPLPPVEP